MPVKFRRVHRVFPQPARVESVYHVRRGRILKWPLSVGILNLPAVNDRGKAHVPAGSDPCRMSRSCSGVYDALADTGDDITAEVGQADRYECPEPQCKLFHRPAEISHGPSRFCRFTRGRGYAEEISDDFASVPPADAVRSHRDGDSLLGPGRR